jgi:hypothetical protein
VSALFIDADEGDGVNADSEHISDALAAAVPQRSAPQAGSPRSAFSPGNGRSQPPTAPLVMRDEPASGVCVPGLWSVACESVDDVTSLLLALNLTVRSANGRRRHALTLLALESTPSAPRLAILQLARAGGGSPGSALPPWVAALAQCLNAVELSAPRVPFASSRTTLLLRDAFVGRSAAAFVSILPAGPPSVVNASVKFAARVRKAVDKLATAASCIVARPSKVVASNGSSAGNETDSVAHIPADGGSAVNVQFAKRDFQAPLPSSPVADLLVAAAAAARAPSNDELAASSRALFATTLAALEQSRAECIALQNRVSQIAAASTLGAAASQKPTHHPVKIPAPVPSRGAIGKLRSGASKAPGAPLLTLSSETGGASSSAIFSMSAQVSIESMDVATLRAHALSLASSNKVLSRTSRDYALYREVVEASIARLQGDVASAAAIREALLKERDDARATLSKEKRAHAVTKRRVTELEAHVSALEAAAVGREEATAAVASLRAALRDARATGAGTASSLASLNDEIDTLRARNAELAASMSACALARNAVEAELSNAREALVSSALTVSLAGMPQPAPLTNGAPVAPPAPAAPLKTLQPSPSPNPRPRSSNSPALPADDYTLVDKKAAAPSPRPPSNLKGKERSLLVSPDVRRKTSGPIEWDGRGLAELSGVDVASAASVEDDESFAKTRPPPSAMPAPSGGARYLLPPLRRESDESSATEALAAALRTLGKRDPRRKGD